MKYTVKTAAAMIGKQAQIEVGGMLVAVVAIDARTAWGKLQIEVRPVAGSGSKWVDLSSLIGNSEDVDAAVANELGF